MRHYGELFEAPVLMVQWITLEISIFMHMLDFELKLLHEWRLGQGTPSAAPQLIKILEQYKFWSRIKRSAVQDITNKTLSPYS